jgi:hypothetical protein
MNRPNFPEYTLPILCLHGTKDITTSLSAAQAFVEVRRPCSLTRTADAARSLAQLPAVHRSRLSVSLVVCTGGGQPGRDAAEAGRPRAPAVHGARARAGDAAGGGLGLAAMLHRRRRGGGLHADSASRQDMNCY